MDLIHHLVSISGQDFSQDGTHKVDDDCDDSLTIMLVTRSTIGLILVLLTVLMLMMLMRIITTMLMLMMIIMMMLTLKMITMMQLLMGQWMTCDELSSGARLPYCELYFIVSQ